MNTGITESEHWSSTVLDGMDLLDKVAELDEEFVDIYKKSLNFTGIIINNENYNNVESEFFSFANSVSGSEINNIDDLENNLWAGYHPIPLLFSRLHWYAIDSKYHYTDSESASESQALKSEIELAKDFHHWLPSNWVDVSETGGKGIFGKVLQAAEARYALDTSQPLTIDQIVVLSGMNLRSVKNALSKNDETGLKANEDNMISNQEAVRWLKERRNFIFTSTYRPAEATTESDTNADNDEPQSYVFVPVTDDGDAFLPELRRTNGYQIGKYGEEEYVEDYFDALDKLCKSGTPRWRRPNSNGNWGIKVSSGSWKRMPLKEIEQAVAKLS